MEADDPEDVLLALLVDIDEEETAEVFLSAMVPLEAVRPVMELKYSQPPAATLTATHIEFASQTAWQAETRDEASSWRAFIAAISVPFTA